MYSHLGSDRTSCNTHVGFGGSLQGAAPIDDFLNLFVKLGRCGWIDAVVLGKHSKLVLQFADRHERRCATVTCPRGIGLDWLRDWAHSDLRFEKV